MKFFETVAFILVGLFVFLMGGAWAYSQKDADFIKHLDQGMKPYVSPMKTLEWRDK